MQKGRLVTEMGDQQQPAAVMAFRRPKAANVCKALARRRGHNVN